MIIHNADSTELAALMVLRRELEPVPEPFRCNPNLCVVVDYSEYVQFIRYLPSDQDYLYAQTSRLKALVQEGRDAPLLKSFYVDMALAVGKELYYALTEKASPTVIRHTIGSCRDTKDISITDTTDLALRTLLSDRGFPLPDNFPLRELPDWRYACKLLQDALDQPTKWVEKETTDGHIPVITST